MSDIVEFLEARITEDEQTALASASREWEWLEGKLVSAAGKWTRCDFFCVWREPSARHRGPQRAPGHEHYRVDDTVIDSSADYGYESEVEVSDEDGEHIVRHDPARVLREVAAKRKIIEAHHPDRPLENWYWLDRKCAECGKEWHQWVPDRKPTDIGPEKGCQTLRNLAAVYSDHPEYQEDWAP